MNNQAQRSNDLPANIPDLVVLLSALDIDFEVKAFLSELHPATIGAVLCALEPQALANVVYMLGEADCAALFESLSDLPDVLTTLADHISQLAPHVAPTDAGGKLAGVSKATADRAKAAAVGRKYQATASLESPDLSAIADSKLAAELSDYGIDQAEKRGAADPAFSTLVKSARGHGATCGASVHKKDAIKFAQALADKMFLSVAVLLELVDLDKAGEPTDSEFPCCADAPRLLVEYVGLANIVIKAAQEKALESMPEGATAKQRSAACKGARNVTCMQVKRQLDKYGVSVNLQTGDYSECELEGGATKAEKACKAVVGAFDKAPAGALEGLALLDGASWAAMVEFVTGIQAKRDRMAREAQNASLSAMSIANAIKAKATDDAARAQAKLDAANN